MCSHLPDSTCLSEPLQGLSLKQFCKVETIGIYSSDRYHRFGIAVDKFTVYKNWAQGNNWALWLTMCSWGYSWQSQRGDSYQKGVPSWGGKRGSGLLTRPSGEVLAWLLLPKRVFKCQILYVWKIFLRGGTKSITMCRLVLGMECRVVRSGTPQFDTPLERAWWYALPGAICSLSEAISGFAASVAPHRSLGLQWWAIPPYFCLIRWAPANSSLC